MAPDWRAELATATAFGSTVDRRSGTPPDGGPAVLVSGVAVFGSIELVD